MKTSLITAALSIAALAIIASLSSCTVTRDGATIDAEAALRAIEILRDK